MSEHINNHIVNLLSLCHCDSEFDFLNDFMQETLFITPTYKKEVFNVFTSLTNSTHCDIDHLEIQPVSLFIDIIPYFLVYRFNLVMLLGKLPS